jgi:hypothetical protein
VARGLVARGQYETCTVLVHTYIPYVCAHTESYTHTISIHMMHTYVKSPIHTFNALFSPHLSSSASLFPVVCDLTYHWYISRKCCSCAHYCGRSSRITIPCQPSCCPQPFFLSFFKQSCSPAPVQFLRRAGHCHSNKERPVSIPVVTILTVRGGRF